MGKAVGSLNSDLLTSRPLFIMHSHLWGVNPNLNVETGNRPQVLKPE